MTFRTRLTFTFSLLTTAVLVTLSLIVYFQAKQFTHKQFFNRLRERGIVTAQLYLERDELSTNSLNKIQLKYLEKLNSEVLDIYDTNLRPRYLLDSSQMVAPPHIFSLISKHKYVEFWSGERQGVGFLYKDNQGDFYIIASAQDVSGQSKLVNLQRILITGVLGSLLVVLLLGYFFARQMLGPIGDIVREVNNIRASNLHLRVKERSSRDEIAQLTQTFNQMLDRLETSFEMQKSFIANASHELRNPLTAISGEIEVALLKDRSPDQYKASLQTLQNETDRLAKLTSDLITLAQTGFDDREIQREKVRLDEVVLDVKSELDRQLPGNKITLDLDNLPAEADLLSVSGSRNLLKIAITNLLDNAVKFSDNGLVVLKLTANQHRVLVSVQDQGMGIPEEEQKYIFQPFYRARNARSHKGTGIGLSMTEKIVKLHQGKMKVDSARGKGTTVTLKFPKKR